MTAALARGCVKAPFAGQGSAKARQAYLSHFQALMRDNPGKIAMLLEDFVDTQMGEHLLQVVSTSDGEPGQGHIYDPKEREVTKVSRQVFSFSRAGPGIDSE